jgi:ATPase family associated with various cellular activities (AAA)/Winged helix domain, variant
MTEWERRAIAHLLLRLGPVNRLLRLAAARRSLDSPVDSPLRAGGLSLPEIEQILDAVETLPAWAPGDGVSLDSAELESQAALEAGSEMPLPLHELRDRLGLSEFELECVLLCAAVEVDTGYERVYGYILDDLGRGAPCVELLCSLSASDAAARHARRAFLQPHSRLVRLGILRRGAETASEWRREIRLTGRALSFLLGNSGCAEAFQDPDDVLLSAADADLPWGVDEAALERASRALGDPTPAVVTVYGPRESSQAELPRTLAARAGRPLRRVSWDVDSSAFADAASMASRLGAILWLPSDPLGGDPSIAERARGLLDRLGTRGPHLVFSGRQPMRQLGFMAARPWIELPARSPSLDEAGIFWAVQLPKVEAATRTDIALRYRLSPTEVRAVANVFRSLGADGEPNVSLERACRTVARRQTERFAKVVTPRRGPEDLVLPPAIHESVLDVARFARAWPRVAERWGLARFHPGGRGVRALFTGPSGTGKTLAAEVIAGALGQELHKIDLASLVSKWVGETEKNLDSAFSEAEQSQAVLFFDEADALFSKRGEVKHGMDRYAKLEVSYLLQRLEEYAGVVVLASNLKENLDEAFSRRFHVVVEFPRPAEPERRRLWTTAFPPEVPREGIDAGSLAKLEMTGATIVNAARTAALLAATDGNVVRPEHVIEGIAREYRRESRILLPAEMGALRPEASG